MRAELTPTLWRSCRVLANQSRLRILRLLLQRSPQTVAQIAASLRMPVPVASQYLRLLQARGLLWSERAGRQVFYSDHADPLVPSAAGLLDAMRLALSPDDESLRATAFALTAFTHPRRLRIVQVLGEGPMTVAQLAEVADISPRALRRHVHKLQRRGVLLREAEQVWASASPSPLMQALIRQVRLDAPPPATLCKVWPGGRQTPSCRPDSETRGAARRTSGR